MKSACLSSISARLKLTMFYKHNVYETYKFKYSETNIPAIQNRTII